MLQKITRQLFWNLAKQISQSCQDFTRDMLILTILATSWQDLGKHKILARSSQIMRDLPRSFQDSRPGLRHDW